MATLRAARNNGLELDSGLLSLLRGGETSRRQASVALNQFIVRYNTQRRTLAAHANDYSLDYVQKRNAEIHVTIKTLRNITKGLVKLDPKDQLLPKLYGLIDSLYGEFKLLSQLMRNKLNEFTGLNRSISKSLKTLSNVSKPQKVSNKAINPSGSTNARAPSLPSNPTIGNIQNFLPPEAQAVFKASTAGVKQQNFTTSQNRQGVIVINQRPGTGAGVNSGTRTNYWNNQQQKNQAKAFGDFSENINTHLEKIQKYLQKISESNGGLGGHGGGGNAWNAIKEAIGDLVGFNLLKKTLTRGSAAALRGTQKAVTSSARGLYGKAKAVGSGVADSEAFAKEIEAFKAFSSKKIAELNTVMESAWSKVIKGGDASFSGIISGVKNKGKAVSNEVVVFKTNLLNVLEETRTGIVKWGGSTLSGFSEFSSKFGTLVSDLGKTASTGAKSALGDVTRSITKTISGAYSGIQDLVGKGLKATGGLTKGISESVGGAADSFGKSFAGRAAKGAGRLGMRAVKTLAPVVAPVIGALDSSSSNNRLNGSTVGQRGVSAGINLIPGVAESDMIGAIVNHLTDQTYKPGMGERFFQNLGREADDVNFKRDPKGNSWANAKRLAADLYSGKRVSSKDLGSDPTFLNMVASHLNDISDQYNFNSHHERQLDTSGLPPELAMINAPWAQQYLQKKGARASLNRAFAEIADSGTEALKSYSQAAANGHPPDSIQITEPSRVAQIQGAIQDSSPKTGAPVNANPGGGTSNPANGIVGAAAILGNAAPDLTDDDYRKNGWTIPKRRGGKNTVVPDAQHMDGVVGPTSALAANIHQSAYSEDDNSRPGSNDANAITVHLDDPSIRDLALLIYALISGRKLPSRKGGGSGGLMQNASYTVGGSSNGGLINNGSGGGGFGGGYVGNGGGGGSGNAALGGNFSGGGGNTPMTNGGIVPHGGMRRGHGGGGGDSAGSNNAPLTGSAVDQNMDLLRRKESFRAKPYWDVNHWRVGYGSDTITDKDGNVRSVQQNDSVSKEDAERDLKRRVGDTQAAARRTIGGAAWDKLNPGAKAALGSIAYNYGSIPHRIVGAVRSGDNEQIAKAVEGLSGDNNGVNARRRQEEANIIRNSTPENSALASTAAQANAAMSPGDSHVIEKQGQVAQTRKMPIQQNLKDQLEFAAQKNGVEAEIFSGGQASEGPNRTGSHRHDNGGAADLKLYQRMPDGSRRLLDMRNPADAKIMGGFTRDAVRAGATGVGGATDYMGPSSLHIGGGTPAAWGAGGHGAPDPMVAQAFKEGMDDQKGGKAEFEKWKTDRANAAIKPPDAVSAIDPQSKKASIFAAGNTPTGITPGMGLGAMVKRMQDNEGSNTSGGIGGDGKYPTVTDLGREGKGYDASANMKPRIDQAAVMRKFGIGGDGSQSEADYGANGNNSTDIAYRTDLDGKPQANTFSANGGLLHDKSDWTDSSIIDPRARNQQLLAHAMRQKGLTPAEIAQGMGQVAAETDFMPRSENVHYSAAQLHKLWPSKFPTIDSARSVVRQGDAAIANRIYGNRMGNNGYTNAGYNYRGHGDIQLTGRAAYLKMDKALGMNGALVKNPELANDPVIAARISAQYLADRKANGADISTAQGATNAVGPAGDRAANARIRGSIADSYRDQTNGLADKGALQAGDGPSSQTDSRLQSDDGSRRPASALMAPDTASNARLPPTDKTPAPPAPPQNNDDSGTTKSQGPSTKSGDSGSSNSSTNTDTKIDNSSHMTSAMNQVPMSHQDLGIVAINSRYLT